MSNRSRATHPGAGPDVGTRDIETGEPGIGNAFAAAFRATRMPMVVTDPRRTDNPIAFANAAFLGLTGYREDEVLGRNCRFLQGKSTDRRTVDRIRVAMRAEEGIEVEILNYRRDGSEFWNALVISPVRDESGELLSFVASQFDISDKKRVEFELCRSKAALEGDVARRTVDLKAALDQKTALLHELDHRVKNNLQTVLSLILMKARRQPDEGTRAVLLAMADRINALSTAHRLLFPTDDVSRFDLSEFVGDLVGDLLANLPDGEARLALDVERPVNIAAAQATPLALLLNEILGRSVRSLRPDRPESRLAIAVRQPDGGLRIVIDDGALAPPAEAEGDVFSRLLIDMLARQLHATVDVQNETSGRRITISVPPDLSERKKENRL